MANLGLEKFLQKEGLDLVRTKVGDRYVVEAMREKTINIGGEPSGHVILNDYATTGDGLVTALQVLAVVAEMGIKVSQACHLFDPYPQLLENVRYQSGDPLSKQSVKDAIAKGEQRFGESGRVVIRKSGTEPLIRVMAEGEDQELVHSVVGDITSAVSAAIG